MYATSVNTPDESALKGSFSLGLRKLAMLLALSGGAMDTGCQGVGGPHYQRGNQIAVKLPERPASAYDISDKPATNSAERNFKILLGLAAVASVAAFFLGQTSSDEK
jgi:hypothetical protein